MPELSIKTSKTAVGRDIHLAARVLQAETGEQVIMLVRVDGREKESDHLLHEWQHTVERTLVHSDEPTYERMEGALKELNGLLKAVQISDHIQEVNAILGIFGSDNILHVSQAGRAEGYLTRAGSTSQITERAAGKAHPQFLYISNGDLQPGDVVLLSTERVLRCMTTAQLSQAARSTGELLETVKDALEADKESAALAMLVAEGVGDAVAEKSNTIVQSMERRRGGRKRRKSAGKLPSINLDWLRLHGMSRYFGKLPEFLQSGFKNFQTDLQNPKRKHRAHLLLLAGAIVVFIGIWSGFQVTTLSRRNQDRTQLKELVDKINEDIHTAENRQLMGDMESANSILNRAEEEAKGVMQNDTGLFRTDALDLLDRIREKRESINNIIRLTPTIVANLTSKNPSISARGLIGIERGRLIVYDRQNLYSIIVNAVDEPQRLDGDNLILDGTSFKRFGTTVFMTKENRLIELIEGQPTAMKTDDPAGWLTGPDIETYIRFLYVLSPQNNQILKYERLSNRYGAPTEYNVNGNLEGAIDMTIDSDVYVLKPEGEVVKLFRGEERNFTVRNLPTGALDTATKIVKPSDTGNFYFLDPENARIIVTRADDELGESLYVKQYVLEGDQIGTLQDLYVDEEETQLVVLDEKRVYSINLQEE